MPTHLMPYVLCLRSAQATPASPPSVEFSKEQFGELMEQVDGGDPDQKAYAAMELQVSTHVHAKRM
jgi:hypothetical protein